MKKGFILMQVLFIFIIIMISSTFIYHKITLQTMIDISYEDKIQSDYLAESKINKVFFDDYYYKNVIKPWIITDINKNTSKQISMDNSHLDSKDSYKYVISSIVNYPDNKPNNRKYIELKTETQYKGITSSIKASGPIVNDIFEVGSLPIVSNQTGNDLSDFYKTLENELRIENISNTMESHKVFDYDEILIKRKSSNLNEVIRSRNGTISGSSLFITNNYVFLIIENTMYKPLKVIINNGNDKNVVTFSGIMYLEGDLEIFSNFDFNGILILKGETSRINVNPNATFKFRGIILTEGSTDYINSINLIYDSGYIYRYGVHLPGFLNPRLEIFKKF